MQTLTIQTQITAPVDHTIEIPVPCFLRSKDEKDWLAVLDNDKVIRLTVIREYANLSTGSMETFKNDVVRAWQTFHACTEQEFLMKYDEIIESMHPTLKP